MNSTKVMTAQKIIEYGFATPQRRTAIIENALQPPTFILDTKYPDIERATAHYLKSERLDESRLLDLDRIYQEREAPTDHQEQRLLTALDAISHVREMSWNIEAGTTIDFAVDCPTSLEIAGLQVRIKAPVILKQKVSGIRRPRIGVLKPYFGKTFPLHTKESNEPGTLFSTLLHWYCEENLNLLGDPSPSLCIVGDVFSERTHIAAKRYAQRRKQLTALAQEIVDRWDAVRRRLESKGRSATSGRGK